ncbi:hypothetical protein BN2475_50083 [Paraburkholderia ribeironis]|uniref:Uncharacterized protein n=1 Tax=Paraburkholderia ribeironis TaxID=1247936 RepID=A0A1N7RKA4_9BURK|nr:hypothetical protein [Paraburkholderia ribeironis]SIT35548.1 hypothetical protein BN2475_50083 [Paraburkholderia ribeironis]
MGRIARRFNRHFSDNIHGMLPVKDLCKSYGHGFEDIGDRIGELIHMDPNTQAAGSGLRP